MLDAYPILTLLPPLMAIVLVIVTKKVLVSMGAGVVVAALVLAEFNPVTMVVWMASSVASTAMLGAAPLDKAGMASSAEAVSYEFGTLLSVAVFGSLLPFFYAMRAPAEVAGERGHTVGGAWRANTYPGAACDVPSHLYSYSFSLTPNWSKMYASQPEILEYVENVAKDEGILPRFRFDTNVTEARWNDEDKVWLVHTETEVYEASAIIMAVGYLSDAKMPEIEGLDLFEGQMFHSAEWDHSVSLEGKRVAVIGSGASAIQVIPEVAKEAEHLLSFQRSAAYVTPRHDPHYTEAQKRMFQRKPELMEEIRADLFWANEERYAQRRGTETLVETVTKVALQHLENQVSDPELRAKLTPDYTIGCKRILKSNEYFPTFTRDNVSLITGGVAGLTQNGIIDSEGQEHEVDVVIAATGFEATDIPLASHVYGREGQSLKQRWDRGMEAYKTTAVSGFPNMWFIKGPNTGLGHNSAIYIAEAQMDYVLEALELVKNDQVLEVRTEEQEEYMHGVEELSEGTVWLSGGCRSWYVDERSGRLTTLWPDFSFTFREINTPFVESVYDIEHKHQPALV